jgi:hypothetical protein
MITAGSSVATVQERNSGSGIWLQWREYQALDLFGDKYYDDTVYTGAANEQRWPNTYIDLQNRDWDNPDKVKENIITLNAGISFSW